MVRTINTALHTNNTNRTENFDRLTADIRSASMLTAEEEQSLFEEYATASESRRLAIKQRIATANLRFALAVAKQYTGDADLLSDLVSVATFGLYKAVEDFRLGKGFKFISFAVHKIRAEFSEYFRTEANLVRRTNNSVIGNKDLKVAEKLYKTLQREPSEDEIADALKAEFGIEVRNRLDIVRVKTDYLSDRIDEDGATAEEVGEIAMTTASTNAYEEEIDAEDKTAKVNTLLACVPLSQRDIVARAFGIGYDRAYEDAEIADTLGYTAERIRQIKNAAIARMKIAARNKRIAM